MPILDFRWLFLALAVCLFPFSGLYIGVHVLKPYVLFGFIYVAMALWCLSGKVFYYLKTPFVTAVLFFLLYIFLSFFWSDNQHATLMALIKITFVLVLCFVWAVDIKENNKQFVSSVILTLSALVVTVFSLWKCYLFGFDKISLMFLNGAVHSGAEDFTNFIMYVFVSYPIAQYHHGVAIYVVFCFALVSIFGISGKNFKNNIMISTVSLLSIIMILATLSKTAIISYFLLLSVLFFLKRWVFFLNLLIFFVVIIINPVNVKNAIMERFNIVAFAYHGVESMTTYPVVTTDPVATTDPVVKDAGVSERIKLWKTAINLFLESRWFGHGYRSLGDKYDAVSIDDAKYPHNIVLQILSELGVFGFILFLAMFFSLLIQLIKSKIRDKFILYGFIMMSLPAIFISLQLEELYIWLGFLIVAIYTSSIDGNSSGASV